MDIKSKGISETMGISASQARLLTITARLTSNEYESQQISNAKMRLATQSESASTDYIAALNSTQLQLMTYDAQGTQINTNLTASALFQYSDLKNQYSITNASGQALISYAEAQNFRNSDTLDEFLACYGVEKEYKSPTLRESAYQLSVTSAEDPMGVKDYYEDWMQAINQLKTTGKYGSVSIKAPADETYAAEKKISYDKYNEAIADYEAAKLSYLSEYIDAGELQNHLNDLSLAKADYSKYITYDNWIESHLLDVQKVDENGSPVVDGNGNPVMLYPNANKYYEALAEFNAEAKNLNCQTMQDTYQYSDGAKAQWYTNLWYRLNGSSSDKSSKGLKESNFQVLDNKLANSAEWIKDALKQGAISLELASYKDSVHKIPNPNNPLSLDLQGITWSTAIYSACSDLTEVDNQAAIARAEAEYERKTKEIDAKDNKYQNQIKALDTEHNTLQTEYEAVQTAMSKNIDRSFKTFSG